MTTQLLAARAGRTTDAMRSVAASEGVTAERVRQEVARGHAVIPANPAHAALIPTVAGRTFRTKINANLGYSPQRSSLEEELAKLASAIRLGADFVMDLSVGSGVHAIRDTFIEQSRVPLGTVPIYEALSRVAGDATRLTAELLLEVIRDQAEQGVDFMTLHAGFLRAHIPMALARRFGIASRGGAILAKWMTESGSENPLYTAWDDVLAICRAHDVTVSLGDGLRPGCLADASDEAQFAELDVLGDLVARCRETGVQVMVEGPGHVPLDQIQMNMEREADLCDGAPFYVLGPIVTDIAPGYDHITSAIGATMAAYYGAALLCYVTPAEHLGLPNDKDVRDGVIAYKIAAHAADVALKIPGARDRDDAMTDARRAFNWERQFELALDGETARARYEAARDPAATEDDHCSMCGQEFCALRNTRQVSEMGCTTQA